MGQGPHPTNKKGRNNAMRRTFLLFTLVGAFLLACTGGVMAQQTAQQTPLASLQPKDEAGSPKVEHVDGEILVKFKNSVSNQKRADAHQGKGGKVKSTIPKIDVDV